MGALALVVLEQECVEDARDCRDDRGRTAAEGRPGGEPGPILRPIRLPPGAHQTVTRAQALEFASRKLTRRPALLQLLQIASVRPECRLPLLGGE